MSFIRLSKKNDPYLISCGGCMYEYERVDVSQLSGKTKTRKRLDGNTDHFDRLNAQLHYAQLKPITEIWKSKALM